MGMNATCFDWRILVEHLMTVKESDGTERYSVLVFDNRGVGNSSTPKGPYSTSGMAEDIIILLDYIGWTATRQLHVVGISLGGMIAQEFAWRASPRITSLSLVSTSAGAFGLTTFPPLTGIKGLVQVAFVSSPDDKMKILTPLCYPKGFLDQPAVEFDRPDITYYEYLAPLSIRTSELIRPQSLLGALSQGYAAIFHRVTPERLAAISKAIPKVYVMTGDTDYLMRPSNSYYLKDHMKEAEFEVWPNTGHGILGQHPRQFPKVLQRVFGEGCQRLESSPQAS